MTSVTFPFFVGTPGPDKKIPLLEAEFRFTTKSTRAMQRSAREGLERLLIRGQDVEALVLMVCYSLAWDTKKFHEKNLMTEDRAVDLIDEFIDAGGDTKKLFVELHTALYASGVFGPQVKEEAPAGGAGADGAVPLA